MEAIKRPCRSNSSHKPFLRVYTIWNRSNVTCLLLVRRTHFHSIVLCKLLFKKMLHRVCTLRVTEKNWNMSATYIMRQDDSLQSSRCSHAPPNTIKRRALARRFLWNSPVWTWYRLLPAAVTHLANVLSTAQREAAPRGTKATLEVELPCHGWRRWRWEGCTVKLNRWKCSKHASDSLEYDDGTVSNEKRHLRLLWSIQGHYLIRNFESHS